MSSEKEEVGSYPTVKSDCKIKKWAYLISVCRTLSVLQPSDPAESLQTLYLRDSAGTPNFVSAGQAAYHFAPENC
jgi:hypothetical protein